MDMELTVAYHELTSVNLTSKKIIYSKSEFAAPLSFGSLSRFLSPAQWCLVVGSAKIVYVKYFVSGGLTLCGADSMSNDGGNHQIQILNFQKI
jgi:hypothetical protein